jgi:hypothetical protein
MRPAAGNECQLPAGRTETDPSVEILTGTSHVPHIPRSPYYVSVVFAEFRRTSIILPNKGLTVCPFRHIAAVFAFLTCNSPFQFRPCLGRRAVAKAERYSFPDHEILTAIAAFNTASREEPKSTEAV